MTDKRDERNGSDSDTMNDLIWWTGLVFLLKQLTPGQRRQALLGIMILAMQSEGRLL